MTKTEFSERLAQRLCVPRAEGEKILNAFLAGVEDALAIDGKLALRNFGTFRVSLRGAREGRNPKTGEIIEIAAQKSVNFTPSPQLKKQVA